MRHHMFTVAIAKNLSRSLCTFNMLRYDTIGRIELIPSIVLSSNNTNCKNDIQLIPPAV